MMERLLMSGNHVVAESAIRAGCTFFAGYPITPQSEIVEYMATHLPQRGGVFVQAESEVAACAMVYGAAATGHLAMTASSGPGFTLLHEGLSYLAAAELPALVVDVMRRGPGLCTIEPAQSDYLQATKGGGHGDYRCIAYAPANHDEASYLTFLGFQKAVQYRNPVILLLDGALGQMMEPVRLASWDSMGTKIDPGVIAAYAVDGALHRPPRRLGMTVYVNPKFTAGLREKYTAMRNSERRFEALLTEDAEAVVVAYGITARVAKEAVRLARQAGVRAGLFRPVSLWPFPYEELRNHTCGAASIVVAEMSLGQLVEDVVAATRCGGPRVSLFCAPEGIIPESAALLEFIRASLRGETDEVKL